MQECMELLKQALSELELPNDDERLNKFMAFQELVISWNEKVNLTSITDPVEFVLKHFIDSLLCTKNNSMDLVNTVIDVGTGAGFPGIPLAIIYPEKQFFLLDSLNKRVKFLEHASAELGLKNVTFGHGRAEDFGNDKAHREQYDLCVSRAVARLAVLSEYCLPFVKPGGYFAAYKTANSADEIAQSANAFRILGGKLERIEHFSLKTLPMEFLSDHQIIYIKKLSPTPKQYPRKAGLPAKSAL